ncbi:MAG: inosine/xanthosine triphosphatase [Candidatus Diapherotrites archaeon]|uniref:inosine/xanthosine triphosphatase n=1 Tax=Candidatus Iainarchaeum sp. TaxID=3101447 RepID=A0A8T4L7K3_9ARCH|nr:inosine/xanthosine triphosphatase [Candidatus Diapherotrites archaeon]
MKIVVASKNPVKLLAVTDLIPEYPLLADASFELRPVSSDVSEQPLSLEEILKGAIARAKNAFSDCDLSFGIESGLMAVPYTKTGFLEVTVCVIFDGKEAHIGCSSAFEVPIKVMDRVLHQKMELAKAVKDAGLTKSDSLGKEEGIIGILTRNRVTRKDYTQQAIRMALIHLENAELYA